MWYSPLTEIKSKGVRVKSPSCLSEINNARKQHKGQFFTPQSVVRVVWDILKKVSPKRKDRKISILDNSIGKGSMLFPSDPKKHTIYGCDIDDYCIACLEKQLSSFDFEFELLNCGFEAVEMKGKVDFALINPPFSINIDSPLVEQYESNRYGKYSPYSSVVSHHYALEQAVNHSACTIALLPYSFVKKDILQNPNLLAVYKLPKGSFLSEGANVDTCICVLSNSKRLSNRFIYEKLDGLFEIKKYPDSNEIKFGEHQFSFYKKGLSLIKPSITIPVTGDNIVRLVKCGKNIKLKYNCGAVQAMVHNAILESPVKVNHKLPKKVKYKGQGLLDIEIHIMQKDPMESFNALLSAIRKEGGTPCVDDGLLNYFKKRIKKHRRIMEPMGHVVFDYNGLNDLKAVAQKNIFFEPGNIMSPFLKKGDSCNLEKKGEAFFVSFSNNKYDVTDFIGSSLILNTAKKDWVVRAKGKSHAFPELDKMWRKRAEKLKINEWLSRDFQMDDLIEAMIMPSGFVCAWDMGLGKTRFSLACILLSGVSRGLIVVKPSLIHEFIRQIKEDLHDYISIDDINIIQSAGDLEHLKKINFISTTKLGSLINKRKSKNKTYAKALRRKVGLLICDEAHFLSNFYTKQSRAIKALSAKKTILMSGTIMANYPRNLHPILNIVGGDGTAHQNWGFYNGFLDRSLIDNMCYAKTGAKAFMDEFVTLEWCTHEFADGLIVGAKREVPKIKNILAYRKMLAPFVKRRVLTEPDVKRYVQLKKPNIIEKNLDWDLEHLSFYRKIAMEFAVFWKNNVELKNKGLAAIFPRLNAIIKASNIPFIWQDKFGCFSKETPKDKEIKRLVSRWSEEDHQSIVYVNNPIHADKISNMLSQEGIKSASFHGKQPHSYRAKILNNQFKRGKIQSLIATVGTLSEGENLENASRVLFNGRQWSPRIENQCYSRVIRPGQEKDVEVVFLHYRGGIDCYMKQMVDNKQDCYNVGLDYADPLLHEKEFLHLDKIMDNFVNDLLAKGVLNK